VARRRRWWDWKRVPEVMLLAAAVGLWIGQGARIARSGVSTYSLVILGVAVLLLLLGAALARSRRHSRKSSAQQGNL
jgi:hypothetical protein